MLKLIKKVGQKVARWAMQKAKQVYALVRSEKKVAVGTAVATVSSFAMADGVTIDPTAIVTTITSAITVISAMGMAVLSLVVAIKTFKWVQRVL